MKYLIANLKAHHSLSEIQEWMTVFTSSYVPRDGWTIGIAPSFPHLAYVAERLNGLGGCCVVAQSVYSEEKGSFTGEVPAAALHGIASLCLVGHSERRKRGETYEQISQQIQHLSTAGITPILCIGKVEEYISGYQGIVLYEPPNLIGTGTTANLDAVLELKRTLAEFHGSYLYGASVDENNCGLFIQSPEVDGMVVGTASIEPRQFLAIVSKL